MDDLLAALKTIFIKLFEPFLATFVASLHALGGAKVVSTTGEPATQWNFAKAFEGWDKIFDKLLKGLEDKAAQVGTYTWASDKELIHTVWQDRKSRLRTTARPAVVDSTPPSDDVSTCMFEHRARFIYRR